MKIVPIGERKGREVEVEEVGDGLEAGGGREREVSSTLLPSRDLHLPGASLQRRRYSERVTAYRCIPRVYIDVVEVRSR